MVALALSVVVSQRALALLLPTHQGQLHVSLVSVGPVLSGQGGSDKESDDEEDGKGDDEGVTSDSSYDSADEPLTEEEEVGGGLGCVSGLQGGEWWAVT